MKMQYQGRLFASTSMAASEPPDTGAEEVIRAAVRAGAALLTDHGILIPPWVLLDVITLRSHRHGIAGIPAARHSEQFQPYDDWLREFLDVQSARLGRPNLQQPALKLECIAALARCWPRLGANAGPSPWKVYRGCTFAWIGAYRSLESRATGMLTRWRAPRRLVSWGWGALAAALNQRKQLDSVVGAMVDAFLQGRTNYPVHELFDAGAAHIYLSVNDPDLGAIPATRRISQYNVSRSNDPPELDSVEELHHALGVWTLSMLTQGRYGLFKLANQSYDRMAGRPRSQPPRIVRIHLEWALSIESLERPIELPASLNLPGTEPNYGAAVNMSEASILQAFVALVIDDWRCALTGVLAELHVRARCPEQNSWQVLSRGRRWKADFLNGGPSPPAQFVQRLFRRTTTVELLTQPGRSVVDSNRRHGLDGWHCGCVLENDLEAFNGDLEVGGWTCPYSKIPRDWDHVIVVDPEHAAGWITKAEHRTHHVYLRKLISTDGRDDLSFLNLRRLVAETMLETVARYSVQAAF